MDVARAGRNRPLRARLPRYLLLVCTIMACFGILLSASDPATIEPLSLSPLLILGGAFVAVVVWCVVIVYPILAIRSRRLRVDLGPLTAPALVIALTAILWSADLPIAVRWRLSARAFEYAAEQVRVGVDPRTFEGDRLGLYRIHDIQRRGDDIYFGTGPLANHCSLGSGLANFPGQQPPTAESRHLSGDWYWFCHSSATVEQPDYPIGKSPR